MPKLSILAAATAIAITAAGSASAAFITQFNKTTNDGVFALSQAQADWLGYSDADFIAFFRPREGNGTAFDAGDTFDSTTMANSVTSGGGNILAFLNGTNAGLTYTGDAFDDLGTTTVGSSSSYFRGVAFLFESGAGNIVFKGSSTFNGGQAKSSAAPVPVPVPAALPLGLLALGGLGLYRRQQRRAKQS